MKTGKFSVTKEVLLGLTALSIATAPVANAQTTGATYLAETASVVGACGKLFEVDANAANMTAAERAAIIQKNLDYAIIHAKNRAPSAVQVVVVNRNPVVTVDSYHIATADGNSAARNRMTQMELAQKWADSIRFCLANAAAMDKYLSMLTGNYAKTLEPRTEHVAYLPAGSFIPVKLATPICSETAQIGDRIAAVFTNDVPLRTSFTGTQYEAYLPAGTAAVGQLVDASNSYTKKALSLRFDELRLPDGEVVPINGHIFGGIGTWVTFNPQPHVAEYAHMGANVVPSASRVASKGTISGAWRGNPIGASMEIPFKKLTITRRLNLAIAAGEPMMLQFGSPSAIAVLTNTGPESAGQSVAQGGANMGGSNASTNPLAGGSGNL